MQGKRGKKVFSRSYGPDFQQAKKGQLSRNSHPFPKKHNYESRFAICTFAILFKFSVLALVLACTYALGLAIVLQTLDATVDGVLVSLVAIAAVHVVGGEDGWQLAVGTGCMALVVLARQQLALHSFVVLLGNGSHCHPAPSGPSVG